MLRPPPPTTSSTASRMPTAEHGVRPLLLSCAMCLVTAGVVAAASTEVAVYSLVLDPRSGVPLSALSPPPISSGFSTDFSARLGTASGGGFTSPSKVGFSRRISSRTLTGPGPGPPNNLQGLNNFLALANDAGKFFMRFFRAFHASPAETVRFDLYTRPYPAVPTRIYARKRSSVEQSTFDPQKPSKIIIHGFLSHQGPGTGGDMLKNAFLATQDCNVITVDWSGVDPREYGSAVNVAVPRVANEMAELVRLMSSLGAGLDDFHLIGHSLGGQIAGLVGSQVLGPAGAGRITGLDPAGPLFEGRPPSERLDSSDAAFVDVIHTDGGMLGAAAPIGHVDFYPEGGMHVQPGCGKDSTGLCSHCLVYDLLTDAILHPGLNVYRSCASWKAYKNGECYANGNAVIGPYTDPRSRGSYYSSTNMAVRPELQRVGEKDFLGLLTLRRESGARDGVAYLRC